MVLEEAEIAHLSNRASAGVVSGGVLEEAEIAHLSNDVLKRKKKHTF